MSIDITFTLSNEDLQRFEDIVVKAKDLVETEENAAKVEETAQQMIDQATSADLPEFIAERILKLETLLNMVQDEEWKLEDAERKRILSALSYFALAEDLIPDHVPGVGFLDDAIYTEIIIQELESELRLYNEFCQYRIAEENRRRNRGLDPKVGRKTGWQTNDRCCIPGCGHGDRAAGAVTAGVPDFSRLVQSI